MSSPGALPSLLSPDKSRIFFASASSVTHPLNRSCTVCTGTASKLYTLSNSLNCRKSAGNSFWMPGTSVAATTTSNVRSSAGAPPTPAAVLNPFITVGFPEASFSYTRSVTRLLRKISTPRSSRYLTMGLCRNSLGDPSSMRRTDASVRTAKSWKMVNMHRADVLSQSMKPNAYAMGSHMRLMEPRDPPLPMNHSLNEMLSKLRMSCNAPSKSNKARTTGDVANATALAILSLISSCDDRANAAKPLMGAPTPPRRKSSSPMTPPVLTNVCVCSFNRRC